MATVVGVCMPSQKHRRLAAKSIARIDDAPFCKWASRPERNWGTGSDVYTCTGSAPSTGRPAHWPVCYSPWARWITTNPNPSTATDDERSRPAMPSSVSSACNQVKSMDRHIDGRARFEDPSGGNKRARESTWIEDVHNGNKKSRFRANSNIII